MFEKRKTDQDSPLQKVADNLRGGVLDLGALSIALPLALGGCESGRYSRSTAAAAEANPASYTSIITPEAYLGCEVPIPSADEIRIPGSYPRGYLQRIIESAERSGATECHLGGNPELGTVEIIKMLHPADSLPAHTWVAELVAIMQIELLKDLTARAPSTIFFEHTEVDVTDFTLNPLFEQFRSHVYQIFPQGELPSEFSPEQETQLVDLFARGPFLAPHVYACFNPQVVFLKAHDLSELPADYQERDILQRIEPHDRQLAGYVENYLSKNPGAKVTVFVGKVHRPEIFLARDRIDAQPDLTVIDFERFWPRVPRFATSLIIAARGFDSEQEGLLNKSIEVLPHAFKALPERLQLMAIKDMKLAPDPHSNNPAYHSMQSMLEFLAANPAFNAEVRDAIKQEIKRISETS